MQRTVWGVAQPLELNYINWTNFPVLRPAASDKSPDKKNRTYPYSSFVSFRRPLELTYLKTSEAARASADPEFKFPTSASKFNPQLLHQPYSNDTSDSGGGWKIVYPYSLFHSRWPLRMKVQYSRPRSRSSVVWSWSFRSVDHSARPKLGLFCQRCPYLAFNMTLPVPR